MQEGLSNTRGIASNIGEFQGKGNNLRARYGLLMKKDDDEGATYSLSTSNIQESSELSKSPSSRAFAGGSNNAKTESILQKLSDMRQKMSNMVNPGPSGDS